MLDEQIDHGPILAQKSIKIAENDNYKTLHDKLSHLGAELLAEILPKYIKGEIKPITQKESEATYCQILTKKDSKIDWNKSAEEIERQIRAFSPCPNAWTFWNNKSLKIIKSVVYDSTKFNMITGNIGEVFKTKDGIGVKCGKEALEILELQLEGKKQMPVKEFINGYPTIIGSRLS